MSLATIPKPAERTAWLRARHGYFNASAVAAFYDCHPFIDLADVTAEKLAPEPPDDEPTEAMERGTRLEPLLLDWFGDLMGVQIATPNVLYTSGRLMATLDGEPVGDQDWWVEAKTTAQTWDAPPAHVYWQMVGQSAASGRSAGYCVWLDADMRLKHAKVTPEPEHVADVLDRAEQFMAFIDMGMVPEGVLLGAEQIVRMHPAPSVGTWVDVDEEGRAVVAAWDRLRRLRVDAEKQEAFAKDEVARLLGDAEGVKWNGLPICTWRRNKPTRKPDMKRFLATRLGQQVASRYERDIPGPRVLRATKELHTFGAEG